MHSISKQLYIEIGHAGNRGFLYKQSATSSELIWAHNQVNDSKLILALNAFELKKKAFECLSVYSTFAALIWIFYLKNKFKNPCS